MSDKANKHKIVANISDMTRKQIDELQEATGITTTAQLVSMAIDRMHREECGISADVPIIPKYKEFIGICQAKRIEPDELKLYHYMVDGEVYD